MERFEKGGGGMGGFGGRGMMMMGGNFDEMFDRFARGKDVIRRDDLDPMMQFGFDMMARRMNITGNEITRDQARQFSEQMQARMREGGGMGGFGGGGMGGGFGGGMNQEMVDRFTEEGFRRRDRNGDGLLDANEMSDGLKAERDKWDTNKDGFIDLNEYKAYASARFGDQRGPNSNNSENPSSATTIVPPTNPDFEPDYRRPTVFRFGYLPKELPDWFAQLDVDQDGQIALHEWVKGGRPIEKFREMDSNDDDFVIAEEVLRFQNGGKITNYNLASAYNSENREPAYRFNRDNGGGGRGPGGGGGRGGPGGGNWMGGDRGSNWMGGGQRGNGDGNNGGGRGNWMNGGGGGPGGGTWGNRGPGGGNGNNDGGGRPRGGPGGGMEKGMGKGGMEKGMGKGGRDRGGNGNGDGGRRP
jgi:hypothetical protein